jgi:hypothetical protein
VATDDVFGDKCDVVQEASVSAPEAGQSRQTRDAGDGLSQSASLDAEGEAVAALAALQHDHTSLQVQYEEQLLAFESVRMELETLKAVGFGSARVCCHAQDLWHSCLF